MFIHKYGILFSCVMILNIFPCSETLQGVVNTKNKVHDQDYYNSDSQQPRTGENYIINRSIINKVNSTTARKITDFSEPTPLSDSLVYASSPNLVQISLDTILAVYSQYGLLASRLSTNGGEMWNPTNVNSGIFGCYSPSAFRDSTGTIHIYYIYGDELRHATSSNNGTTWSPYEVLYNFVNYPTNYFLEASYMPDNSVWFNYFTYSQGYILKMYPDGSFGEEIALTSDIAEITYTGNICSLPNGDLMLVYQAVIDGNSEILRRYSSDNGSTWTNDEILFSAMALDYRPYVYVSNNDVVWILFTSNRSDHYGYNIWYSKSTNNGLTW